MTVGEGLCVGVEGSTVMMEFRDVWIRRTKFLPEDFELA
jgi:hypothetical protein